ncbi:MAG: L,D-transpeptidase [Rhodothermales bacterium]|nr:L,D-transpeptidase [Rhodothermales bacterium]
MTARIETVSLALIVVASSFLVGSSALGQEFINQTEATQIVSNQSGPVEDIPDVYYQYYVLSDRRGNTNLARNTMYKVLGNGDVSLGKKRSVLVGLLNRTLIGSLSVGDTVVVPNQYDLDFRAYSPFPRFYAGGREFDKLFIIDKSIQAFAAYEKGRLTRWGIVNTGAKESPTPNGRYNFNWRTEYRISSLSPRDEPWEMWWVFNFHQSRGIHIHQFAMPTGGPTSHGCVRLIDDDAMWVYGWADAWKTTAGDGFGSETARLISPGTTVLVIGEDPGMKPEPFIRKKRIPVLKMIEFPEHPYDVPPGTPQQEMFDRARLAQASESTR